jgi:hypothetical protein
MSGLAAAGTAEATLAVKQVFNRCRLMFTAAATVVMETLLPLSGRIWHYEARGEGEKWGLLCEGNLYSKLQIRDLTLTT